MDVNKDQIYIEYLKRLGLLACGFVDWLWACSLDALVLY
jgi:hypothetical protein